MNYSRSLISKYSHGGDVYRNQVLLDFSVNGNPLGPPPAVLEMLRDASRIVGTYPDTECEALRAAIETADGVPAGCILCTNGATEFFTALSRAVAPRKGLILIPAFSEYERSLEAVGTECIFASGQEEFLEKLPGADIAYVCNPVNPTGLFCDKGFLKKAVHTAEEAGTYLVVDESFLRFSEEFASRTMRGQVKGCRRLVVVDSFTKFYGIPGLRLGFGCLSDRVLMEKMKLVLPLWNVSGIAQSAGVLALSDHDYREQTVAFLQRERPRFTELLKGLGMRVAPSEADFLFFESEIELYHSLLDAGVLIRDCRNYRGMEPGVHHYRVAVRRSMENEQLIWLIRDLRR